MIKAWIEEDHECCFHFMSGPIDMTIPDGHVVLKCCQCKAIRTEHGDHCVAGYEYHS